MGTNIASMGDSGDDAAPCRAGPGTVVVVAGHRGVVQIDPAKLRAARLAADLTQAQLAARLGTTQSVVSAWERGDRRPDVHQLVRLAAALGVNDILSLFLPGTRHTLEVLRIRAGLTQAKLAGRLGMSPKEWRAIEQGHQPVPVEDAGIIATALGVNVAQVLAAGPGDSVMEVVEASARVVALLDAEQLPGESRADTLDRLLSEQ
jgi:transcriptional regulator with XRE-family HTH domain